MPNIHCRLNILQVCSISAVHFQSLHILAGTPAAGQYEMRCIGGKRRKRRRKRGWHDGGVKETLTTTKLRFFGNLKSFLIVCPLLVLSFGVCICVYVCVFRLGRRPSKCDTSSSAGQEGGHSVRVSAHDTSGPGTGRRQAVRAAAVAQLPRETLIDEA